MRVIQIIIFSVLAVATAYAYDDFASHLGLNSQHTILEKLSAEGKSITQICNETAGRRFSENIYIGINHEGLDSCVVATKIADPMDAHSKQLFSDDQVLAFFKNDFGVNPQVIREGNNIKLVGCILTRSPGEAPEQQGQCQCQRLAPYGAHRVVNVSIGVCLAEDEINDEA